MALVKQGTMPQVMSMGRLQFHLNTLLAAVLSLAVVGALNAVRDSTPFKSTTGLDVVESYGFPAPFYLRGTWQGEYQEVLNPFSLAVDGVLGILIVGAVVWCVSMCNSWLRARASCPKIRPAPEKSSGQEKAGAEGKPDGKDGP